MTVLHQRASLDAAFMSTRPSLARPCTHKIRLNVRFALKATEMVRRREMTLWAKRRHRKVLFDHLVGESEQVWWQFETD